MTGELYITDHAKRRAVERFGNLNIDAAFRRATALSADLRRRLAKWQRLLGRRRMQSMMKEDGIIWVLDKAQMAVLVLQVRGVAKYALLTVYKMPTKKEYDERRQNAVNAPQKTPRNERREW